MQYQLTKHQKENFRQRQELLAQVEKKYRSKTFVSALYEMCKRDFLFWINMFGWTFDPRLPPSQKEIPFLLYNFQEETIKQIFKFYYQQRDLFIEKSRDMGLTWIVLHVLLHRFLFEDNFTALIGSRKESLVDGSRASEDLDPLMLRMDFVLRKQPSFFLQDYNASSNRTFLSMNHPNRKSVIKGESANPDFGRQGRYGLVYIDEFGSWQFAAQAWQACSQSSPCRLITTTPSKHGMMHHSSRLRESGKIAIHTVHWRKHPFKDDNWYQGEKQRMTEEEVAREIDISYQTSIYGAVYSEWHEVITNRSGEYPYNPNLPLYVSWDFGMGDDTALIWWQKDFATDAVYLIDSYSNSKRMVDYYFPFVNGGSIVSEKGYFYGAEEIAKIEEHKSWRSPMHFGDPSARQQHQSALSTIEEQLRAGGIYLNYNLDSGFPERRDKSKLLMRRLYVDTVHNQFLIDCIYNARYPERTETSQATTEARSPVHDQTSHFRTAFEFFADNEPENILAGVEWRKPERDYLNKFTKY